MPVISVGVDFLALTRPNWANATLTEFSIPVPGTPPAATSTIESSAK